MTEIDLSDHYPLYVRAYARVVLQRKFGLSNVAESNASVLKAAKLCGISLRDFVADADAYLAGGCGIAG